LNRFNDTLLLASLLCDAGNTHHEQSEQRRDKRQRIDGQRDSDALQVWRAISGSSLSEQRDQGASQHRAKEETEHGCALHKGITGLQLIFWQQFLMNV